MTKTIKNGHNGYICLYDGYSFINLLLFNVKQLNLNNDLYFKPICKIL
jgi:hypothetical protein